MKKIVLIIAFCLLIVGCGQKPEEKNDFDAKTAYLSASESMKDVSAIDLTMIISMNIEGSDAFEMIDDIETRMQMIYDEDFTKIKAGFSTSMQGYNMDYYLDEGYIYIDMFGVKMKQKVDASDIEMFETSEASGTIIDSDKILDLLKYEKQGDNTVFTLELKSEEEIKLALGSVDNGTLQELEAIGITYERILVKMVTNKDSEIIEYVMDMDIYSEEENQRGSVKLEMKINAYGDAVVIDFPDFSGYTEQ